MVKAPVLKTGVRKDFRVRIPGPPLGFYSLHLAPSGRMDVLLDISSR